MTRYGVGMTSMPGYRRRMRLQMRFFTPSRRISSGNDGLTDAERQGLADSYEQGPGRGLTSAGKAALMRLRERESAD